MTIYRLHVPAVKPGDFGPCALGVVSEAGLAGTHYIKDGSIVEAIGPITTDGEGVSFRAVRTESGLTGRVCWSHFDGRSGFERIIG